MSRAQRFAVLIGGLLVLSSLYLGFIGNVGPLPVRIDTWGQWTVFLLVACVATYLPLLLVDTVAKRTPALIRTWVWVVLAILSVGGAWLGTFLVFQNLIGSN